MAPTKQQVLDSLAKVPAPDGTPLTETGVLSDVVVTDGKVFFSLTVDAARGQGLGVGAQARRGGGARGAGRDLGAGGA